MSRTTMLPFHRCWPGLPACCAVLLLLTGSVAAQPPEPAPAQVATWRFDAQRDLPDGAGKALVVRACTRCHDLGGLPAYRGYWGLAQWQEMVAGMVKNGALLNAAEATRVALYLNAQYGADSGA